MARNESDREDLMREAVNLPRRMEFRLNPSDEPELVGLNSPGWLFVYSGHDPMYRFDEQGRLRRAFVDGMLYRTHGSVLASLERTRSPVSDPTTQVPVTTLVRRDLSPGAMTEFRRRMLEHLKNVLLVVMDGTVTGQHPADEPGLRAELQYRINQVIEAKEFLAPAIVRR